MDEFLPFFAPGVLLGALIAELLTKRIMLRGYIAWGIVAGLLLIATLFGLGQYYWVFTFRSSFGKSGPCGTCGEWIWVPFVLLWGNLVTTVAAHLILSAIAFFKLPKGIPRTLAHWPKSLRWWIAGLGAVVVVASVGSMLYFANQRARLVKEIQNVSSPISDWQIRRLGAVPLPDTYPVGLLDTTPPYVERGGLTFSPDGRWMMAVYDQNLELWSMSDLKVKLAFKSKTDSWGGHGAFSPDGSLLVVITSSFQYYPRISELKMMVYSTENLDLLWQTSEFEWNSRIFFSPNNKELIIYRMANFEGQELIYVDARTGSVTHTVALHLPQNFLISQDGKYLATRTGDSIEIYESQTGYFLTELEVPRSGDKQTVGSLTFLPHEKFMLWHIDSGEGNNSFVWDIRTGIAEPLGISYFAHETPQIIGSPDSHFAIFSTYHKTVVWDLEANNDAGSIPVTAAITAVAFTPDQRLLAVATADGYISFFAAGD